MGYPVAELYVVVITIEQQYHNYCADILDCNFHINVLQRQTENYASFPMDGLKPLCIYTYLTT